MAETIRAADYFYIQIPNKPGEGAHALKVLREAGVNLLAFSGFPAGRVSQLDFVPEDPTAFRQTARKAGWKLVGPKRCLLLTGADRIGAMADLHEKLAAAKINVTAVQAVCAGGGQYAAILWVAPRDMNRASKLLGVQ